MINGACPGQPKQREMREGGPGKIARMEARSLTPDIGAFVALGDSFTEGLGDARADGSGLRGWADRFAERLAEVRPGLRYANLAVRGKVVREVARQQTPRAIAMRPDLVSLAVGGNDLLRPRADPDELARGFDDIVARLREAGCQVIVFAGFDPGTFPVIRLIRGKAAVYNMHLRAIAARRECYLVDLWSMSVLADPRLWRPDRLHLSSDGHRRVALRACEVLGVPVDADWRAPLPAIDLPAAWPGRSAAWLAARRADAQWARDHAAPWLSRRLRGVSSGDSVSAKRPQLQPMSNAGAMPRLPYAFLIAGRRLPRRSGGADSGGPRRVRCQ
jgi:lysophospholipase L1-like esterase